jgi:hypothetical protein
MAEQSISPRLETVETPGNQEQRPLMGSWPMRGPDAQNTVCCSLTEARLVRAYLALFLLPWEDGMRSIRLARFGAYEVRIVEFAQDLAGEAFPLWLELYAHDVQASIDSCGCGAFEDAVGAADELLEHASALHLLQAIRPVGAGSRPPR